MKIRRITTLSFAISEKYEKKIENRFRRCAKGGIFGLGTKEGTNILHTYLPIGKFKVTRFEDIQRGNISTKSGELVRSYFHIDLSSGEIYCMYKNNRLDRYDTFKKLLDLSPEAVKGLGYVFTHGETLREELDHTVVLEIARRGLIRIFKPRMTQVLSFISDEISNEENKTQVKDRIKVSFYMPRFNYAKYNLSNYLATTNTVVESYRREPIRYSVEKISKTLEDFFDAEASLEAIIFLPCIRCEYIPKNKNRRISGLAFPVCLLHDKNKKYKEGIKLRPISLGTELLTAETIPVERPTINFSDVAELDEVKEEIRKEIIYPMVRPDLAKGFGKKGGGGILLYGPPGCGKTYISTATIGECGASFFNVNISDLVKSGAENGPKILHEIFENARKNAPSVVFFDEIDAIGGKKGMAGYIEKTLIDQFLTEMDGVESMRENILFIAATNAPWAIDPTLRRSGRFTKQIFIPPPDLEGRIKIFKIHTRSEPLSSDIDFKKLAELTEDYSSSDIKAICDSAAEIPWGEALSGKPEREIAMADFLKAISKQKSSIISWFKVAQKEIEKSGEIGLYEDFAKHILKYGGGIDQVKKPDINFSDVGNLNDIKEEIRKRIIYPILRPDIAKNFEMGVGGGILLYGPPGCGKTYIAMATAGECNASFFNVRITDIISSLQGETEKNIHEIFERANSNTPAIIFFDEIDAILGHREFVTGSEKRILAEFLTEMDGFMKNKGIMIIAATNEPWAIDPALRRSERFTKKIFIPPPNINGRIEIFKVHTRKRRLSGDVDLYGLSELTEGYASSDIKAICDSAAEIPWGEALSGKPEREIAMADFLKAISKQKSSIISWFEMAKNKIEEQCSGKDDFSEMCNTILKFEVQRSKRPREISLTGMGEREVESGVVYLIEEERPNKSIEFFVGTLSNNIRGLYITREYPDKIGEKYSMINTDVMWLSSVKEHPFHIEPRNLEGLSRHVREFTEKNKNGVVMLDGIEYLITQNGYEPVLKLIQSLNDIIALTTSRIIISLNPKIFNMQELSLIERECKKIL